MPYHKWQCFSVSLPPPLPYRGNNIPSTVSPEYCDIPLHPQLRALYHEHVTCETIQELDGDRGSRYPEKIAYSNRV